jgi:hypothetical protein
VPEVVVDVLEVVDVDEQERTHAAVAQRRLEPGLQAVPVRQVRE